MSGSGSAVYASSGSVALVDTGTGDQIGGGMGSISATLAGSNSRVYGGNGPLTINVVMHTKLNYDPIKDFAPIALGAYVPHALVVGNQFPAKTLQELIERSKTNPVTVATSGVGSATHFTLERLKAATGAKLGVVTGAARTVGNEAQARAQYQGTAAYQNAPRSDFYQAPPQVLVTAPTAATSAPTAATIAPPTAPTAPCVEV